MPAHGKFTPDVQARLMEAIKLGAPYRHACKYAGIDESTFYSWLRTKPQFLHALRAQEGYAVSTWLAKIEKAASDGEWRAASWKLEHLYPEEFGEKVQVQHSGSIDINHMIQQVVSIALELIPDAGTRATFAQRLLALEAGSPSPTTSPASAPLSLPSLNGKAQHNGHRPNSPPEAPAD